jgi:5-methylcytosine-specific restriction endonuclease McrA
MPAKERLRNILRRSRPLSREEGMKILVRDRFQCQYCGLDGLASFENGMMMTVDFVIPRALKGRKDPRNLVTACRLCNLLKGRHKFRSFEEAKQYVLQRREQQRLEWEKIAAPLRTQAAPA